MAAKVAEETPPPKKKGKGLVVLVLVAVVAAGGGFAAPRFLIHDTPTKRPVAENDLKKQAVVPFGDLVVNLGEERLTRLLRVKIMLAVDGHQEQAVTEHVTKQKAFLKNWLIGYLSDLSLQEVSRTAGVNRLRREIRDQFNAMLWPDGRELLQEVLFDEFVVQ